MRSLQNILTANVLFSVLSALCLWSFNEALQPLMGFSNDLVLPIIASAVLCFAVGIAFLLYKKQFVKKWILLICGLDALWVLISLSMILFQTFQLTMFAYVLIAVIALPVGMFGAIQYKKCPAS